MRTVASIFTGGGGWEQGARRLGLRPAWGIEYDPLKPAISAQIADAYETHLGAHIIRQDAALVDPTALAQVDILLASPPCQGDSRARSPKLPPRSDREIGRCVVGYLQALTPRVFLLENVEGYKNNPALTDIVRWLVGAGYAVQVGVLNAADYGVPQTRRRLILRAVRSGGLPPLPDKGPWQGWYAAIEHLVPILPPTQFAPWQIARMPELGDRAFLIGGGNTQTAQVDSKARFAEQPAFTVSAGQLPSHTRALLVNSKNTSQEWGRGYRTNDEPAWTVVTDDRPSHAPRALLVDCQYNNGTHGLTVRAGDEPTYTITASIHQRQGRAAIAGDVRAMIPAALAAFQSFDPGYQLPPGNEAACRLIGNAVPPLLAQRLLAPWA